MNKDVKLLDRIRATERAVMEARIAVIEDAYAMSLLSSVHSLLGIASDLLKQQLLALASCEKCGKRPAMPNNELCEDCVENAAEATEERRQEGECFRGGEYAAFLADQQAKARELK